jgi:hypothetical protein
MPGFNGTGPMGMGLMTGGGRGFCNPCGTGVAVRRYGIPRWGRYGYNYYSAKPFMPGTMPSIPQTNFEQELAFLKQQNEAMRAHLNEIEAKIKELAK